MSQKRFRNLPCASRRSRSAVLLDRRSLGEGGQGCRTRRTPGRPKGLRYIAVVAGLLLLAALARTTAQSRQTEEISGVRDPAWAPDGKRLALSLLDRLWTMAPDGRQPHALMTSPDWSDVVVRDPSWSSDGKWVAFSANRGQDFDVYNGNPRRDRGEAPPVFGLGSAYRLWSVAAPAPVDEGVRRIVYDAKGSAGVLVTAFDEVWKTLKDLYYCHGESAAAWDRLREKYRPQADAARSEPALESIVDEMILGSRSSSPQ